MYIVVKGERVSEFYLRGEWVFPIVVHGREDSFSGERNNTSSELLVDIDNGQSRKLKFDDRIDF